MDELRISAYRIFVPDVAEALPFYRDTLGFPVRALDDNGGFAVLDAGIMLILEPVAGEPALAGRFTGVSFEVKDIAAAYETLRQRGVAFTGPPKRESWGGTLAHLTDPAGNTLTLVEYPKS